MKTIIEMALEAGGVGINDYYTNGRVTAFSNEQLKVFAELVRADEREACARVAERSESALHCAAAIRARGDT